MNFKLTLASAALVASTSFALIGPGHQEKKTICLNAHEDNDGVLYGGSCDNSANNKTLGLKLLANGCAEKQISVVARKLGKNKYTVEVANCLPPHVVQL